MKYAIGLVVCCLCPFPVMKLETFIESLIHEDFGWKTDLLFLFSLFFLIIDGGFIIFFSYKFFSLF